jgi:DNA-binding NarL/FixJ family response regulator
VREWPFVGRDDELAKAVDLLRRGRSVLVVGDHGIGRTRLLDEVVAVLTADGIVVEVVDDAHHLDDAELAAIRRRVRTEPVLLSARTGTSAARTSGVERIELGRLRSSDILELVAAALDARVDEPVMRWIRATSRGVPLYASELLDDARQRGFIVLVDGTWELADATAWPSRHLLDVVAEPLEALTADERSALELLAVGEPMDLAQYETLVGVDVVTALERAGLVAASGTASDPRISITEPIHGEALRGAMGPSTARAHRRRLIEAALARGVTRPADAVQLAVWRCDDGDTADWPSLLDAARALGAGQALGHRVAEWEGPAKDLDVLPPGRGNLEVAVRLMRAALAEHQDIAIALELGGLLQRVGWGHEVAALDAYVDAMARTDVDRLQVARARCNAAIFFGGDVEHALAGVEGLLEIVTDPAVRRSARVMHIELLSAVMRSPARIVTVGAELLADGEVVAADRVVACMAISMAAAELGRFGEALDALEEASALATERGDGITFGLIVLVRVVVLTRAGRFGEANDLAMVGLELARDNVEGVGLFAALAANVHLRAGRVRSAETTAAEAVRSLRADTLGLLRDAIAVVAQAQALRGRPAVAEATLAQLEEITTASGIVANEVRRSQAWIDVAAGRTSAALRRLEDGAARARASDHPMTELDLLHDLTRLGRAAAVADRAVVLAELASTPLAGAVAAQAVGLRDGDADVVAGSARAFRELGCRLWEAEAWAQAASLHRAAGRRSSAHGAAEASRSAAAECEGASTPAMALLVGFEDLTTREREVASLAARGAADKEIAQQLGLSVRTVGSHLYNVYAKLGVEGRSGIAEVLGY